jgi:hypothetical protein
LQVKELNYLLIGCRGMKTYEYKGFTITFGTFIPPTQGMCVAVAYSGVIMTCAIAEIKIEVYKSQMKNYELAQMLIELSIDEFLNR